MASFRVDDYVVDVLLRDLVGHDRSPAAFLVYLFLWRRTAGRRRKWERSSHREIAEETGLSKSAVQQALRILHRVLSFQLCALSPAIFVFAKR